MIGDRFGDVLRKLFAIDGQCFARRHAMAIGRRDDQRIQGPHFFFETPDGAGRFVRPEGITADELGEPIRAMRDGFSSGPHFVQDDAHASVCELPRSLAAREPAADDDHLF